MESLDYYRELERVLKLEPEEKMLILYKLMESLNVDITNYISEDKEELIITPCVIVKTLMLNDEFLGLIKQLYSLEDKTSVSDELSDSLSLVLR